MARAETLRATAAPIRGELLGADRLLALAGDLARSHRAVRRRGRGARRVRAELRRNGDALRQDWRSLAAADTAGEPVTPAAEWLLDNFQVVEEQLREIREDLPPGFYRQLPKLTGGPFAGRPRVFALAWAYVEHTDSRLSSDSLVAFLHAYQRVQPLTFGELWAVAISLRLVLVENLRRLSRTVVMRRAVRSAANALAEIATDPEVEESAIRAALDEADRRDPDEAFVVELAQRLRDGGAHAPLVLAWLDERARIWGIRSEDVVREEHLRQVAVLASVRNTITSMRLASSLDWADLVEEVSVPDRVLREGTAFAEYDFPTRDLVRHAIEDLARGSTASELDIAEAAVARARSARTDRTRDVGWWLLDAGRAELERQLSFRPDLRARGRRAILAHPSLVYLGTVGILAALALGAMIVATLRVGAPVVVVAALTIFGALPATELVLGLVQRALAAVVGPRRLPRMDFESGVPSDLRTLVAIPAIVGSTGEVEELVERLEVHALANDDPSFAFALLTDWTDAATERADGDEELLARAREAIDALDARYRRPGQGRRFFLVHRRRVWNEQQRCWMGWERKRGKLHELNRILRGATDTTIVVPRVAELADLGIRYVLTLDSDTRLPRDTVRRLVGTIAHPLHRAEHDPRTGAVVRGYGILQPRVVPSLPEQGGATPVQTIHGGPGGIDPYAFAVSDVYQDLYGAGIFTGKGIYDVDAFERALAGRVPENTLLSHDLFEGLHARVGFVSDVELLEPFPAHQRVAAARAHRWMRGDWQLVPWLLSRGPFPAIGRWMMLDNLRRSLAAPAALATIVVSWLATPPLGGLWTLFVLGSLLVPQLVPSLLDLVPSRASAATLPFFRAAGADVVLAVVRASLATSLLVDDAWRSCDAIARTLARLWSRRRLLEWMTPAHDASGRSLDQRAFARWMLPTLVAPPILYTTVLLVSPWSAPLALPFCAGWMLAPLVAWRISIPSPHGARPRLDADRSVYLRMTARETWRFFETFVTADDHALPPDNFQEEPRPVVAHRTSPTNIGMYLLASVAAHDFGWIGRRELASRVAATLATVKAMQKHRGHLLNWYDTRTLAPLHPRYVSTVDSGNLAGHLLVVQQTLVELAREPETSRDRVTEGIRDALTCLRRALTLVPASGGAIPREHLEESVHEVEEALSAGESMDDVWWERLSVRAAALSDVAAAIAEEQGRAPEATVAAWAAAVSRAVASHRADRDPPPHDDLTLLAATCDEVGLAMEWDFLFDEEKCLFAIGFNVDDGRRDESWYDMLASEARLASFTVIARGALGPKHWFRLGRRLTEVAGGTALLSWSGSMFEYLMPDLVMAPPQGSLLSETMRRVVARQIRHGRDLGVPWGISEAAYNSRDRSFAYQYSTFGVAGLGLKRGLGDDLVIAPYATALAAMVDPVAAADNLLALERAGARGAHGFYESVDYTKARLPEGARYVVVHAYMAHHQAMSIVAIANVLLSDAIRRRFHAIPAVQATELLLHERTPRDVAIARLHTEEGTVQLHVREPVPPVLRTFRSPHGPVPETHRLSNGRYSVAMTAAGSGHSRWGRLAVSRWRQDDALDAYGAYLYLRDVGTGTVWSAGFQPVGAEPDEYEASFYEHRIGIRRRDGVLTTQLDVVVSTEDDAELWQLAIVNHDSRPHTIEVTSYREIVLAPHEADRAHPSFSNLFVRTLFEPKIEALLAVRRPRSSVESAVWVGHVGVVHAGAVPGVQFETDRMRFVGRGRTVRTAMAVFDGRPLSNTTGLVLDPVLALRRRCTVEPGGTARILFATVVGHDRDRVLAACDRYREQAIFERTLSDAWTHAQVQLRHLGVSADEAHLYQRLGTRLTSVSHGLRPPRALLERNRRGQASLWRFGISGDRPLLLGRIAHVEDRDLVRQLVRAQGMLQLKGQIVDLVLLTERPQTYGQELQATLEALVRANQLTGVPLEGAVHLVRGDLLSAEDHDLLVATARVVVSSSDGSFAEQMVRVVRDEQPSLFRREAPVHKRVGRSRSPTLSLTFSNGVGGFENDGQVYVTVLGAQQWTPVPWSNVIANPDFGTLVTESGGGCTWALNSHEHRLTPWSNDPVSDEPGEIVYVRDEDTGELWTASPLPIREDAPYIVRHGQGWTRYDHTSRKVALELTVFVAPNDPVKIARLVLRNASDRPRRLSVFAYVAWVLGASREVSSPFVVTWSDPSTQALFARNPWNEAFARRIAFLDLGGAQTIASGDRVAFVGRNGSLAAPAALASRATISGRLGAGMDPCGVLGATLALPPGGEATVVVTLGEGATEEEARSLVRRYRDRPPFSVLQEVRSTWSDVLGQVHIRTPDPALDVLVNHWLLYQTMSCRLFGRSGFYQGGGAYGFRDQLQDVAALALARPDLTREHLLRAAGHQFVEGDVLHWWHPPSARGVRTRISDDRLWLPYVAAHYVDVTGDDAVLDEVVPFLTGPAVPADHDDLYDAFAIAEESGTLFEHCARAIDVSLAVGAHGLPLIGGGDWNDGMNRVGHLGRGESVWLAWFLLTVFDPWIDIARARGEHARAERWTEHAAGLRTAVEGDGWDGDWYRRAFTDDGTPLGSASSVECRIDSIAQSWAVLSKAGRLDRVQRAMAAVDEHLVRRADGTVLLLAPPFDRAPIDPGYIKGYLPGVRENGGQYAHAAVWVAMAFAELGDGARAAEVLSLVNPIHRSASRSGLLRYKGEPYAVAADVYGTDPHVGRAGWTWYTGSAAWMYRAALESLLGIRVRRGSLHLSPCVPPSWPSYEVELRLGGARTVVHVDNAARSGRGIVGLSLDGVALDPEDPCVPLPRTGDHRVSVVLGRLDTRTEA